MKHWRRRGKGHGPYAARRLAECMRSTGEARFRLTNTGENTILCRAIQVSGSGFRFQTSGFAD
jgi:hypothetical protein